MIFRIGTGIRDVFFILFYFTLFYGGFVTQSDTGRNVSSFYIITHPFLSLFFALPLSLPSFMVGLEFEFRFAFPLTFPDWPNISELLA